MIVLVFVIVAAEMSCEKGVSFTESIFIDIFARILPSDFPSFTLNLKLSEVK